MIAWNDAFVGTFESAWGLTQKLAWLNHADPAQLLMSPLGYKQVPNDPADGGRAYIDGDWLTERRSFAVAGREASIRDLADVPRALFERTGTAFLGSMAQSLLSQRLRVCPVCIGGGYHSIVHQIAGLAQCPMHAVPLTDNCVRCGKSLGEFGLRRGSAYRCARCDSCLLLNDDLLRIPQEWRDAEGRTIEALMEYFASMADVRLDWPSESRVPMLRASGPGERRWLSNAQAYLWALHRISPIPVARALLCSEPAGLVVSALAKPVALAVNDYHHDPEQRSQICEQVDAAIATARHTIADLMTGHEDCLRYARYLLDIDNRFGGSHLRCNAAFCPIAQGHFLWSGRVRHFVRNMRECHYTSWIERYQADHLAQLPAALVSAFYGSITGIELMARAMASDSAGTFEHADAWLDAENDGWLPGGPYGSCTSHPVGATHGVHLNDPESLVDAPCDKGLAFDRCVGVTVDSSW